MEAILAILLIGTLWRYRKGRKIRTAKQKYKTVLLIHSLQSVLMHLWWLQLLFAVINYFQTMPSTNFNTGSGEPYREGEMQQKHFRVSPLQWKSMEWAAWEVYGSRTACVWLTYGHQETTTQFLFQPNTETRERSTPSERGTSWKNPGLWRWVFE